MQNPPLHGIDGLRPSPNDVSSARPLAAPASERDQRRLIRGSALALYALALRMVGDEPTAERLVQEALFPASSEPDRALAGEAHQFRIMTLHERARSLARRRRRTVAAGDGEIFHAAPDEGCGPRFSSSILDRLADRQRRVIEAMFFDSMTVAETASRLGMPVSEVRAECLAGMRLLRDGPPRHADHDSRQNDRGEVAMEPQNISFDVQMEHRDGSARLRLRGELDMATAPILAEALEVVRRERLKLLFIDAAELSFIDSSGVHLITEAITPGVGVTVSVTGCRPAVKRVFEILGLEIFTTSDG